VRVLFATKGHLPILGGAEVTTHWLALDLQRRGHAVGVLARQDERRAPLPAIDRSLGYLTLRSARPDRLVPRVMREFAPDVVVVGGYHAETAPWARSMLRATAHLPTCLHLHDHAGAPLVAERDLRIDAVVAVSDFLAAEAERYGARVVSIPPPVERRRYRVPTRRRVALFINPVPQKGLATALALAGERPDIPFAFTRCWYIAPAALESLRAEARRLGNVEIRPAVREPAQIYGDARVLLVPSIYPEAWARVVPEAQMSGIPVLASRVGGLPEAVGGGGTLVDPEAGTDVWASALAALWDDEAAYEKQSALAGEQGRRTDLESAAVVDRFEAVLNQVVERTRLRRSGA
jgi:glycosyltransferase involved in cell wall biosynthesis